MAKTDKFYIGQLSGAGMQTDLRPFAIPDEAFQELNNCYIFRGRLRKRFGTRLMQSTSPQTGLESLDSRFKVLIGTTTSGAFGPVSITGVTPAIGQAFSAGSQLFTAYQDGALLSTGPGTGTYSIPGGSVSLTGTALPDSTPVYFYPATPVMGLISYESTLIEDESIIGFDLNYAYQFTASGWQRLSSGTSVWTGDNSQFFWGTNYRGSQQYDYILFVTNFNAADGIRYYNGSTWAKLNPPINNAGSTLVSARIILPFKNRLVCFNTIENISSTNQSFTNRCRFSQDGNPIYDSSSNPNAWNQDVAGAGGYIEAPTQQAIITAQFLRDRLIVFFERSTWELVYTNNRVLPFIWQKIDTELGVESTFSNVPFDKIVLGIGNVGIQACNGSNVERIDDKIPDTVFEIHNEDNGIERVVGIRDFYSEMVYWSFPADTDSDTNPFNNRILIYNYKTGSWAINYDSFTMFGYFQASSISETWSSTIQTWQESVDTWETIQKIGLFRSVIAGNQEGYVVIIDTDSTRNDPSLQITNMSYSSPTLTLTIINHNLQAGFNGTGDYIVIENAQGVSNINNIIFPVDTVIDANTITVITETFTGTYTGAGTVSRVSNVSFLTKQYNFYAEQGLNASINKVDFLVDKTVNGQITVDYAASSSSEGSLFFSGVSGALLGTGVLETKPYREDIYPLEQSQSRLWHPIYPMVVGECVQLFGYMTDTQLRNPDIAWSDFQMHAFTFYATPTSRLE